MEIKRNIESIIDAVVRDNREYITGTVAEYLLESLNEDWDYMFYLEPDDSDILTEDDREKVREYISKL